MKSDGRDGRDGHYLTVSTGLHPRRCLLLLTRFDALGKAGGAIPFGITLRETATLLQPLGARRAVALDGGISAQLIVRPAEGDPRIWRGLGKVPVGIEFVHR